MCRQHPGILYVNTSHPYHKPGEVKGEEKVTWPPVGSPKTLWNNMFEKKT